MKIKIFILELFGITHVTYKFEGRFLGELEVCCYVTGSIYKSEHEFDPNIHYLSGSTIWNKKPSNIKYTNGVPAIKANNYHAYVNDHYTI